MANQNDFIVKYGLVVESTTTIASANNLVTTNIVRPPAKPSLDFNFTNAISLDPRMSFTRASGGTYVGKDGLIKYAGVNQPRFDYDPVTGQCKGILIEEQITNLVTYSTIFSGGSWYYSSCTLVPNAATAPDGSNTAVKLVEDSTLNRHYFQFLTAVTTNTVYTASVYAKAGTNNYATIIYGQSGAPYTRGGSIVNLTSGTVTTYTSGSPISVVRPTPVSIGNGWWRIAVSVNIDTTTTSGYIEIGTSQTTNPTYTGNNTGSIYLWGAQLETTSVGGTNTNPTSIIPTAGSQATRSVDLLSFQPDQTVFSPFRGTMFINFDANNTSYSFAINGSTLSEIATCRGPTDVGTWNGVAAIDAINASANINTGVKYAISYQTDQTPRASLVLNGGNITSSSTQSLQYSNNSPILYFGSGGSNYRVIDGHIRKFSYWPQQLSTTTLQMITGIF
jgi:hypothetical protein